MNKGFARSRLVAVGSAAFLFLLSWGIIPFDITIPYLEIKVSQIEKWAVVGTVIVIYAVFRFVIDWINTTVEFRANLANRADFLVTIGLCLISILPTVDNVFLSLGLTWLDLVAFIATIFLGNYLALNFGLYYIAATTRREALEALALGLPEQPQGRKVAAGMSLKALGYVATLIGAMCYLFSGYREIWLWAFFPPFVLEFTRFIIEQESLSTQMRRVFDEHDTAYQFHGWSEPVPSKESAIFKACRVGNVELVRSLLEEGQDPNEWGCHGWTPLMTASAENHLPVVDCLLTFNAEPNRQNFHGRTALMYASRYGYSDIVQRLLEAGANADILPCSGGGAVAVSIENRQFSTLKILVKLGANLARVRKDGLSALELARKCRFPEFIQFFCENSISKNKT